MSSRLVFPLFAAAVAALLVVAACATNPATGRTQLILVSADQELQMGRQAVPGVMAEFGAYDDPELQSWVDGIGKRLAAATERPDLPYTYTVLDSPVVNAFALPGGPIFVTRGLIAYANSEAELASVMGHETGHVVARHSAEQASRGELLGLGLGVAGAVSPTLGRFGQLLGAGAQVLLLRYSRSAESEADMLGVRYAAKSGFDPNGAPRFMRVLDQLAKESRDTLPNWLSTHPDPGDRVQATTREAAEAPKQPNPVVGRDALLQHVDGIVFGDDPREGFQKGRTFHHPRMKFRIDFPEGWASSNTRQAVVAVDDKEKPTAQVVLSLVPDDQASGLDPEAYVEQLRGKNPKDRFEGTATSLNGLPAWRGKVLVPTDSGNETLVATWARYGGQLYQILGASASGAADRTDLIQRAMGSFKPEADPDVLAVKPVVVRLVKARPGQTVASFCSGYAQLGVSCRDLADINQLGESDSVPPDRATLKVPTRQSPMFP